MDISPDPAREMGLLEQIESDPDVTQASLAAQLGVAVGTINWHLKRLIAKGYVKVKRAERRKLKYIITPEGIAFRARLTVDYVAQSMLLYRNTRQRVRDLLEEVKGAGFDRVQLHNQTDPSSTNSMGDIVDICRLTCLEENVRVVDEGGCPRLEVCGVKVSLRFEDFDTERG